MKSLSPHKAHALLSEQTKKALENRKEISPLRPPKNPVLRIEFNNYGQAEAAGVMPRTEIEPGTTIVRYEAKDIIEAYQAMLVMTELAMHVKFS